MSAPKASSTASRYALCPSVVTCTRPLIRRAQSSFKLRHYPVSRCRVLILTLAALGFLLGAAVSGMTIRSIRSIMFRLVATMQRVAANDLATRSEEHTSELQSLRHLVCRLLLEKKKKKQNH